VSIFTLYTILAKLLTYTSISASTMWVTIFWGEILKMEIKNKKFTLHVSGNGAWSWPN